AGDVPFPCAVHLDVLDMSAAVDGRLVVLRSIFSPLDWPSQVHGCEPHQRLIGVHGDLAAETTSDFGRDYPYSVLGQFEYHRAEKTVDVRVLAGAPERELACSLVIAGHGGSRLHRRWGQSLLDDSQLHRDRSFGKGAVGVATRHR